MDWLLGIAGGSIALLTLSLAVWIANESIKNFQMSNAWQPWITSFGVVAAALVAWWQLSANRQNAKNKNTLDFIVKFDTDKYYVDLRTAWARLYEKNETAARKYDTLLQRLKAKQPATKTVLYMQVCDFMTLLDVIAESIRAGVFDEEIILSMYALQLVIYWNGIQPYLRSYRENREENAMKTFEALVTKCRNRCKETDLDRV
jgi:hypothetical protein